jgi:hypothetical protein
MSKRKQWKYLERAGEYYRFSFESNHLYDVTGNAIGNFGTICQLRYDPTTRAKFYEAQMEYFKHAKLVWYYKGKRYTNGPRFEASTEGEKDYYNSPIRFLVRKGITTKHWLVYYKGNLYFSIKTQGSLQVTLYDIYEGRKVTKTLFSYCAPIIDLQTLKNV